VSEIIHQGEDGLVMENAADAKTLSEWLGRMTGDVSWRNQLGSAAAQSVAQFTWARNSTLLQQVIESALSAKRALDRIDD
jgi:glycosyltransferase involved in cell wall biosynthesis